MRLLRLRPLAVRGSERADEWVVRGNHHDAWVNGAGNPVSGDAQISALGSGSDHTPFLQYLGVASLNIGFGGEDGGGSYHSVYDSFDHHTRFGDPGFDYGMALAQTNGRVVLRFAEADTLPLDFGNFTDTIPRYVQEVTKLAETTRNDIAEKNRTPSEGSERLSSSPETQAQLNQILLSFERSMTREGGLPRRPWFKHHLYAPGFYTGYGVRTLPGVRGAVEQHNRAEAVEQVAIASATLEHVASEIDRAAAVLQGK